MGYAKIYVDAKKKEIDVKDYDDLNERQQKKAYNKFIIEHKESIEKDCMEYYWFDKNGEAYQLQGKDKYIKKGASK